MAAFPLFFRLAMLSGLLIIRTTAKTGDDTCSIILHCQSIWCGQDEGCYCNQVMYLSSQTLVKLTVSYYSNTSEPLKVVWSQQGNVIINQSDSFQIISTKNSSTLKIKYDVNTGADIEGVYTITVSNACGTNSTKIGIKFRCVYSETPQISTDSNVTPTAGNNLKILAQITVAEMANIHVCFTNSSIPYNASIYNFHDYYCVRCSTTFGSRCISPLGDESIIYHHEFNVTNSYFSNVKNCSSVYTISFHKHHISSKDSGTVIFRVDVGSGFVNKTVSLCVQPGHWKTMYLIGCSTAFALGLLVSVVVYVCYCSRNKMKKPMYQRLPSSLPPSVVSTVSRSISDVGNVFLPRIVGGTEGTIIGTEGPGPDESVPDLLMTENDPASII